MGKRPVSVRSVSSRKVETDGKWGLQVMDSAKEGLAQGSNQGPPHLGYPDSLSLFPQDVKMS